MNKRRIVKQIVESVVNRLLLGEGWKNKEVTTDNAQAFLDKGHKPKDLFDSVGDFHDGFAYIELEHKRNFINTKGKLLSKQWFDKARPFYEGVGYVYLRGKGWNYITPNGEFLCDQWYDWAEVFQGGFAMVELNGKYNFVNHDGEYITDEWFDSAFSFSLKDGFAEVMKDRKWYKMDKNGNLSGPVK